MIAAEAVAVLRRMLADPGRRMTDREREAIDAAIGMIEPREMTAEQIKNLFNEHRLRGLRTWQFEGECVYLTFGSRDMSLSLFEANAIAKELLRQKGGV